MPKYGATQKYLLKWIQTHSLQCTSTTIARLCESAAEDCSSTPIALRNSLSKLVARGVVLKTHTPGKSVYYNTYTINYDTLTLPKEIITDNIPQYVKGALEETEDKLKTVGYKPGDKVWAQYGYGWDKAKIIAKKNNREYLVKIPILGVRTIGIDDLILRKKKR